MTPPGTGTLAARLSWSAENFVAATKEPYLMAGFPGLGCWGRDTLIALPGLFLSTRRFDLARELLLTLGSKIKGGLLPVRFSEEDGSPEYDSADTSLWFFWAVWHYAKATREKRFLAKRLLPICREILEGYLEGTHFGIAMGEDGLITLSDEELPLTWMDSRLPSEKGGIPGRAVTPRFGKPVEVNALWYFAVRVMAHFAEEFGFRRAATYLRLSRLIQQNFQRTFAAPLGILYDRVAGPLKDASIRPNLLIAASLPFTPFARSQQEAILEMTERHLLTPAGVRTLSPQDPQYRGRYIGDLISRAMAYHQGTIWGWLIGPYVSTLLKVRGLTRATKTSLKEQFSFHLSHLEERGLGSVSEIFDGDAPHTPRGSISQAWSVGELLRAIQEADLADL
jgi:predicted glycogen debranching enzyme